MNISTYLPGLFDHTIRTRLVNRLTQNILDSGISYDTICFRGMSGALIVPELAIKLNKPITMLRKNDNSHSTKKIEGFHDFGKYIIVDDFICTGNTITEMINHIDDDIGLIQPSNERICVSIFLYRHLRMHPEIFNCRKQIYTIPTIGFNGFNIG